MKNFYSSIFFSSINKQLITINEQRTSIPLRTWTFFILILLLISTDLYAKKVKFAVDMTGQDINSTGVFVAGDFQTAAGFSGGDWQSNTTPLVKETGTDIYSIIVDIPAFEKYEYKFLNGDQWYDVEFVPIESRVGYDFNDNRWIWVDSLSNDTTFVGAILFGQNAPAGLFLARFLVDMQEQTEVNSKGVHLIGDFQGWSAAKTMLYSFVENIYELILYMPSGDYGFKYLNGIEQSSSEIVPSTCSVNDSRIINVVKDTVLSAVCFGECNACGTTDIIDNTQLNYYDSYPNPMEYYSIIELDKNFIYDIQLTDLMGNIVRSYHNYQGNKIQIYKENLYDGIYFVMLKNNTDNKINNIKLIIK